MAGKRLDLRNIIGNLDVLGFGKVQVILGIPFSFAKSWALVESCTCKGSNLAKEPRPQNNVVAGQNKKNGLNIRPFF